MTSRFNLLLGGAFGLLLVGMAILSAESLPPAAAVQQTGVAAYPDEWTFPPGCVSR
jgi:hypothetical protein